MAFLDTSLKLFIFLSIMGFLALMIISYFAEFTSEINVISEKTGEEIVKTIGTTVETTAETTKTGAEVALDSLEKALDIKIEEPKYEPDTSKRMTNDTGYCYIGTDKGFRSCAFVGPDDICQSGKVYGTMEKCKYPFVRITHDERQMPNLV